MSPQSRRRSTRIVATLGPATDPPEALEAVLRAGVDVVRLNFSHGDPAAQVARAEAVRRNARVEFALDGTGGGWVVRFAGGGATI